MRRLTLTALFAATALLVVNCESPETTDLLEIQPSFGKVDTGCLEGIQGWGGFEYKDEVLAAIYDLIPKTFEDRKSINSAFSHIDNVARKVCDGEFSAATKMAWSFLVQVSQQVDGEPAKQVSPYSGWASELGTLAFVLAWEPNDEVGPLEIPEGAFLPTGGVDVISTRKGGTAFTRDFEAAAVVDPDDYPSGDQVYLVLSRTFDDQLHISGFNKVVPAGYWIMASDKPVGDGVLVQMCVLQPAGMTPEEFDHHFAGLQLGHDVDGETELLPRVTSGLSIDCSGAAPYPSMDQVTASSWLQTLGRFAGTAFHKAFGPEPLRAWRAGGVGLGGRTKSFSPFAPVDPLSSLSLTIEPVEATIETGETVQLTAKLHNPYKVTVDPSFDWSSSPDGVVSVSEGTVVAEEYLVSQLSDVTGLSVGSEPATATVSVTHPQTGLFATASITVTPLLDLEVILENRAPEQTTSGITVPAYIDFCSAGPDTTCTEVLGFGPNKEVTLTAEATGMTGLFDIWITSSDGQCEVHYQGSPSGGSASCDFTMTPETTWVKFLLTSGSG